MSVRQTFYYYPLDCHNVGIIDCTISLLPTYYFTITHIDCHNVIIIDCTITHLIVTTLASLEDGNA